MSEIDSLSRASQNFDTEPVQLTPEAGRLFVYFIILLVDLETEDKDEVKSGWRTYTLGEDHGTKKKTDRKVSFIPLATQGHQGTEPVKW